MVRVMTDNNQWPHAIFFDVGETLIQPRLPYGDLLAEVAQQLDIDLPPGMVAGLAARIDGRVVERTQQMLPFTFPTEESQRFWHETYMEFFVEAMHSVDAERLTYALLDLLSSPQGYALFEDTRMTLERMIRRGYRLGIISNWESWLPTLLAELGLAEYFDSVTISGVCGLEKPDCRIFHLALAESGFRPGEVVYVGDRPAHDIEPALKIGITPILLDRHVRYPLDLRYHTISSLHDLALAIDHTTSWTQEPRNSCAETL